MNHSYTNINDRRYARYAVIITVVILSALISGCFENYGRIKHNTEVTQAFQNTQFPPNYRYYYFGRTNMPYAVIGIDPAYHIQSRVWREVDADTEHFMEMIFWVWDDFRYANQRNFTQGAYILDPQGKRVGTWYSGLWWAAIRFEANKRLVVMPETPFSGGP